MSARSLTLAALAAALLAMAVGRLACRHGAGSSAAPAGAPDATVEREVTRAASSARPSADPESASKGAAVAERATAEIQAPEPTVRRMLYGAVRPAPGRELKPERVSVSLCDARGKQLVSACGPDGEYSFIELQPGTHWIRCDSAEFGSARGVVELLATVEELRYDLQLVAAPEVLVKVVDSDGAALRPVTAFGARSLHAVAWLEPAGEWFEGARPWGLPVGRGRFVPNSRSDARLPDAYLGRVLLEDEPPVWIHVLNYQRVVASKRVERGQSEVELVLDPDALALQPGSLRARFVRGEDRTPISGERVMCGNGQRGTFLMTDADGRVEVKDWAPGWYSLSVLTSGLVDGALRARIEPGVAVDLGDIVLEPEAWIAGVLVDESGQGVAGELRVEELDPVKLEPLGFGPGAGTRTAADGSFRIGRLGRRPYRVSLSKDSEWGALARVADLRRGPIDGLRLPVARGVPLVVCASNERWRDVRFAITDEAGEHVLASQLYGPEPRPILLAPGRYVLNCRVGDQAPVCYTFAIATRPVLQPLP